MSAPIKCHTTLALRIAMAFEAAHLWPCVLNLSNCIQPITQNVAIFLQVGSMLSKVAVNKRFVLQKREQMPLCQRRHGSKVGDVAIRLYHVCVVCVHAADSQPCMPPTKRG